MTRYVFDKIAEYIRACKHEEEAGARRAVAEAEIRSDGHVQRYFHGASCSRLSLRAVVEVDGILYCCERSVNAQNTDVICLDYSPVYEVVPGDEFHGSDDSEPD